VGRFFGVSSAKVSVAEGVGSCLEKLSSEGTAMNDAVGDATRSGVRRGGVIRDRGDGKSVRSYGLTVTKTCYVAGERGRNHSGRVVWGGGDRSRKR